MAKLSIVQGATSQSVNVFIQDSSSTVGAGLAGLAFNTAGLVASYSFAGANTTRVAITLATLATVTTAYSSGGFIEIDSTNMKGLYRLDLPNAALAASKGRSVTVYLFGATNMAPCVFDLELTGWDNQDGVRGGMTALPNAAANAAGGLPVSIAGALDLDEMNVDIEAIQTSTAGLTFTGANKVDASVRDWVGDTIPARSVTGVPKVDVADWLGTAVTAATAGIPDVNAKNWANGAIPAVNVTGVPLVDLKYTLGTVSPATAGSVRADAVTGAVGSVTGSVGSVTGSVGSVTGAVGSVSGNVGGNVVGSVASVTGAVGSVTAAVSITSNVKKNSATTHFPFLMTDSTTHAPKIGLTVTCTRSIDGGAFAAGTLANVTEVSNGDYTVDFGAGDLNGNCIVLRATAVGADDTFITILTDP